MSFEYLITAMKTMPMKKHTKDYVTACLMYVISKCKKNEPQGKDVALVLRQGKMKNSFLCQCANHVTIVVKRATLRILGTK